MLNIKHYKAKRFYNENLSSYSFLENDFRGVTFINCDLTNYNFKNAKFGQKIHAKFFSILIILVSSFISALVIGYSSSGIATLSTGSNPNIAGSNDGLSILTIGLPTLLILLYQTTDTVIRGSLNNKSTMISIVAFLCFILIAIFKEDPNIWIISGIIIPFCLSAILIGNYILSTAFICAKYLVGNFLSSIIVLIYFSAASIGFTRGVVKKETLIIDENMQNITFSIFIFLLLLSLIFSYLISKRATESQGEKFRTPYKTSKVIINLGGTKFLNCNLSGSNFSGVNIGGTDLRNSKIDNVSWSDSFGFDRANIDKTYLSNLTIQDLVKNSRPSTLKLNNQDLKNLNLCDKDLTGCDFSGSDLSSSNLSHSDLSRADLSRSKLYDANLTETILTGAFIEDWAISTGTIFRDIKCDYIHLRKPTEENPDPWRKPDSWNDFFQDNDFADFIAPIIKTLDLYRQPDIDLRKVSNDFKTLDLYHREGIDPGAATIALKRVAKDHPDADIEIVSLEGRRDKKIRLQAVISNNVSQSELSDEYFEIYGEISALPHKDIEALLASIAEKDDRINSLEDMVKSVINGDKAYIETKYNINPSEPETVLLLNSNPKDTHNLRLDEEARELQRSLERSSKRAHFDIESRWAVTPTDVQRALLDLKPRIVHFAGHGAGSKGVSNGFRSLDLNNNNSNEGLILEDIQGNQKLVDSKALAKLFSLFSDSIECIVLNSCYSETQAAALRTEIPYVIGMKEAIGDKASIKFTRGFYDALFAGESIDFAFKVGCNSIQIEGIPEYLTPVLIKK